jgi:hypothetical protein
MGKWEILNMTRIPDSGYVVEIVTRYQIIDEEYEIESHQILLTKYEIKDDAGFIPFDDLTSEIVLNWVFDDIGETQKQIIENRIETDILEQKDEIINPKILNGFPENWKM